MDEPDSEDFPDEARRSGESMPEDIEWVETEVVDTSEVRISEYEAEEPLHDTAIEVKYISPVD